MTKNTKNINGITFDENGVKVLPSTVFAKKFKVNKRAIVVLIVKLIESNPAYTKLFSKVTDSIYLINYPGFRLLAAYYTRLNSKILSIRLAAKEELTAAFLSKNTANSIPNFTLVDEDTEEPEKIYVLKGKYAGMTVTQSLQSQNSDTRSAKVKLIYLQIMDKNISTSLKRELFREVGEQLFNNPIVFIDEEGNVNTDDFHLTFETVDDLFEAISKL